MTHFWNRKRPLLVDDSPETSYAEIRDHRSQNVSGYIPDEVFDAITGRTSRDGVFWMTREQSNAIRAHPQYIVAKGA